MYTTGLTAITAIHPILYTWKADSGLTSSSTILGFSAQNVQSVIPESVTTDSRGFLQLSEFGILAAAVNAIQELAAKVTGFAESFTSKNIKATDELCVGSTCVTESQLKTLLQNNGQSVITITDVPPPLDIASTSVATTTDMIASTTPDTTPSTDTASTTTL